MAVLYGWINVAVLLINVIAISGINELILLRTLAQGTSGYFYTHAAIHRFIIHRLTNY